MHKPTQQGPFESQTSNDFYNDCFELMFSESLKLPTIPNIATKIREAITKYPTNITKIASLVQLDPSITACLIKISNSSLSRQGKKNVASCPEALNHIGLKSAQSIIASFTLKSVFTAQSPLIQKKMSLLWVHSNFVAVISAILALKTPGFDPDRAMLAGLMHDIGTIPILMLADKNPEILAQPKDLNKTITMLKSGIGIKILQNWGFPRDFEDIVNNSENWFLKTEDKPNYTDIIKVSILHSYIGTPNIKNIPPLNEIPSYHKLVVGHLDPSACITLIDFAKAELEQTQNLLS